MLDQEERRRTPRIAVDAEVDFRRRRETHYPIAISDLSAEGCRVVSRERLIPGETVWVQLPSLESLPSEVCWADEWQSGIAFERPMHPAVFAMIGERLAPAA